MPLFNGPSKSITNVMTTDQVLMLKYFSGLPIISIGALVKG